VNWSNYEDVLAQLRSIGLLVELPLEIATSDRSKRCLIDGGDRERRGWYRLHEWQFEPGTVMLIGSYGIFHGSSSTTFKVELTKACQACGAEVSLKAKTCQACGKSTFAKRELTDAQKAAFRERMAEDKKRAAAEREREAARATQWATAVWRACKDVAPGDHPYLVRKQLAGTGGARVFGSNEGIMLAGAEPDDYRYLATFAGCLVVPLCDNGGRIHGLQMISSKKDEKTGRDKCYWPRGMSAEGHYWLIGGSPRGLCLMAEGFATALTLHEATSQPVAVAFAANNLLPVAKELNARTRRRAKLLICSDDDWLQKCLECGTWTPVEGINCTSCGKPHRQTNAGTTRAAEAAMALDNAAEFRPAFAIERPADRKGPTDFNDLAAAEGRQAVQVQFERRLEALKWQDIASTPAPATALAGRPACGPGDGGGERRSAVSVMSLDDAVERFVPLDDGTGECVFDTWTNKVCKRTQMVAVLPAGIRGDDIKRHDVWVQRGACYLDQVGFDPTGKDRNVLLNTWQGWPMRPAEGDCTEILDLLEYLCSKERNARELFTWILQWMAYPLQNPGAKMSSAIIMHGPQGTGKSTVFQVLAKIYGDYSTVLNQRGLEDKFNADWSDSKLFILAEEVVTRAEMWHIKNELKELVTGEWIRVNPKNIAAYRQRNQLNIVYLSNDNQPLPIENDDRRHMVIYTPPQLSEDYYDRVHLEIQRGGVEAFYHYLLHLDLAGFHPKKRPPMTSAKKSLIELSLPNEVRFVNDWINGDLGWPIVPCRSTDMYSAYLRWCRANGEARPRPSNHFFGAIERLPGWSKKKVRIYLTEIATTTEPREVVIPAPDVLERAGTAQPPGAQAAQWLTESVRRFAGALRNDGGDDR
jgi:putative DNA primase/helicase